MTKRKKKLCGQQMIDPGMYLSLKTAKEIFRQQTDKANFTKEDTAIQAADQSQLLQVYQGFREEYSLQQEEKNN